MRIAGIIAFLLVGVLAHGLVAAWALRTFPRLSKRRRATIAFFVALAFAAPVARFAARYTQGVLSPLYAIAATEYLAVVFSVLPLVVVGLALDAAGRLKKLWAPPQAPPSNPAEPIEPTATMTRRQAIEAVSGCAILAGTNGALGWGSFRGRHVFSVEEVPVRVVGLPRALDGYTIAQISDIHVGAAVQERELEEGLSRVREMKPDLIVATGDLVDFDPAFIPMLARALSSLRARDGVTAILGNHDYYTGAAEVTAALRASGVGVLVNQGRVIQDGFALLGVDDLWSRRYGTKGARLDLAEAMVPPEMPRVLLSHQPDSVDLWAGRVALQLSGHTHGGQINPGFSPARWVTRFVAGRFEVNGTTLWVNRGFGVAGPPARLNAPPEVTKIVLVSA